MQLEVGNIVEGKVCTVTKFGAFIDLGEGKTGLVHISEVASGYVKDINTYLKLNQIIKVKVLPYEKDGKIALSIKKAQCSENFDNEPSNIKSNSFSKNDTNFRPLQNIQVEVNFEDKLAKFMKESENKLYELKKKMDPKRKKRCKKKADNYEI